MQNSAFDLEVYVKHRQDDMRREFQKAQQLDAARARGQVSRIGLADYLARLFDAARSWIIGTPCATLARETTAIEPAVSPIEAPPAPTPRRPRLVPAGDAYAGLVVIARASSVPVAKQPSSIGDC